MTHWSTAALAGDQHTVDYMDDTIAGSNVSPGHTCTINMDNPVAAHGADTVAAVQCRHQCCPVRHVPGLNAGSNDMITQDGLQSGLVLGFQQGFDGSCR